MKFKTWCSASSDLNTFSLVLWHACLRPLPGVSCIIHHLLWHPLAQGRRTAQAICTRSCSQQQCCSEAAGRETPWPQRAPLWSSSFSARTSGNIRVGCGEPKTRDRGEWQLTDVSQKDLRRKIVKQVSHPPTVPKRISKSGLPTHCLFPTWKISLVA